MPKHEPTRIALLGARVTSGNLGVGALASGAIRCIRKQWPNAEIYILDYEKEPGHEVLSLEGEDLLIELVNIRFSKRAYQANNIAMLLLLALFLRMIPSQRIRESWARRNSVLRTLQNTDLVLSIAGGDSFADIYGLRRFLYVSLPQVLVILLQKQLTLLPQHIGPFCSKISQRIAGFIVRNAEHLYARDWQSVEILDAMVGMRRSKPKPEFRYDVGFALVPAASQRIRLSASGPEFFRRRVVGLNVSGLLYMGGYDRRNMFGLRADYRELIDRLVQLFIEKKNAPLLLIPHVFGGGAGTESDVVAGDEVYNARRGRYSDMFEILRGDYNPSEIKHVIGLCDFFVGARMHACIAALSQCVPTVPIAYSDKFLGVMETIGCGSIVADARNHDLGELVKHIEKAYDARITLGKELRSRMPGVISSTLSLFDRGNPVHQVMQLNDRIRDVVGV